MGYVLDLNRAVCHSSLLIAPVDPDWVLALLPLEWV